MALSVGIRVRNTDRQAGSLPILSGRRLAWMSRSLRNGYDTAASLNGMSRHMNDIAILYPLFALATWTALVLLLVPCMRIRATLRGQVVVDDFKYGESVSVPPAVSIPNQNYMNLLEVPVLFYIVCLILHEVSGSSSLAVMLAWTYVGLRVTHSAIHLTYNNVIHRFTIFATSNVVLVLLWGLAAYQVLFLQ